MPLGRRAADQLDLEVVQPEPLVGFPALPFDRPVVGQQNPLRTAFDDGGRDAARCDVSKTLGREQHRDVLLAVHLQRVDERLSDVRIGRAGQRREPGLDRIDAFSDRREPEPVDDPLDLPDLVLDPAAIAVGHGDRRGQIRSGVGRDQRRDRGV